MKKSNLIFLMLVAGLMVLFACSSSWHLRRAIKKNPSIVTNTVDTLTVITPGEIRTVYGKDSLIVSEPGVYIKVKVQGDSLQLFYEFLPDTVRVIERRTVFNVPKTRQQVRLDAKNNRLEIRKESQETKQAIKQQGKTDRMQIKKENKSFAWYTLLFGILIGWSLGILAVHIHERLKLR